MGLGNTTLFHIYFHFQNTTNYKQAPKYDRGINVFNLSFYLWHRLHTQLQTKIKINPKHSKHNKSDSKFKTHVNYYKHVYC